LWTAAHLSDEGTKQLSGRRIGKRSGVYRGRSKLRSPRFGGCLNARFSRGGS